MKRFLSRNDFMENSAGRIAPPASSVANPRWTVGCGRPVVFLLAVALAAPGRGADRPSVPLAPREAAATLRLADPGLVVELVAAEPDVVSPVAVAWDEDGRLFVAEMVDYPSAAVAGRVRR